MGTACDLKVRFNVRFGHESILLHSTFGGVVSIDGKLYGLTTGHGIVNHILGSERSSRTEASGDVEDEEKDQVTDESSDCESDSTSTSGSETMQLHKKSALKAAPKDHQDASVGNLGIETWMGLKLPEVLKYLDRGTTVGKYTLTSKSTASSYADFVLIDLEQARIGVHQNFAMTNDEFLGRIDDHMLTCDMVKGEVDIIIGKLGQSVKGLSPSGRSLADPARNCASYEKDPGRSCWR